MEPKAGRRRMLQAAFRDGLVATSRHVASVTLPRARAAADRIAAGESRLAYATMTDAMFG
ncbi:MAG: hypothetical protein R3D67_07305 [Hyphomicrobiaceae bacterium]